MIAKNDPDIFEIHFKQKQKNMKNKIKFFAVLISLFGTVNIFAQDMKPHDGEMGFTFGVNGLSSIGVTADLNLTQTLLFRYYLSDNMAARVGLNFSNANSTTYDLTQGFKTTTNLKSSGLGLNLGVQHNFMGTDRLEPYMAVDLGIGTGGSSSNVLSEEADSVGNPITPANSSETDVQDGSTFSFGITPSMGFNYFLNKWFSVGAEFGWGIWSSSTGDGTTTVTTILNGGTPTINTSTSLGGKSMGIGTSGSGLITVSVFFDR